MVKLIGVLITRIGILAIHVFVTPGFKEQNQTSHMCAQEVHIYNNRSNNIRNNVI